MTQTPSKRTTEHLPQTELFKHLEGEKLPAAAEAHLRGCERCQELLDLLRTANGISSGQTPIRLDSHPSTSDLADYIIRIYDQSLSKQDAANYVKHLQSCPQCFHYTVSQFEEALAPIPASTIQELEAFSTISLADKVPAKQPASKPSPNILTKFWEFLKKTGDYTDRSVTKALQKVFREPAWGTAVALLLAAIIGGGYGGIRYFTTTHRLNQAQELLTQNEKIFFRYPQLSGDYHSKGIEQLMGGDEPEETARDRARRLTNSAIEHGAKSAKARQVLAHLFIFEKQYAKADSVLNTLDNKAKTSPEILNDFGVVNYWQDKWHEAVEYFNSAIKADPSFKEAYFNLALAYAKLDKKEEADAQIARYLQLEKDEGWRNAALNLRQRIRQD